MQQFIIIILTILTLSSYNTFGQNNTSPFILVLGTTQDGGYPHLGCQKHCCSRAWNDRANSRYIVSLALVDPASKKWWLFEATPDIKEQLHYFRMLTDSGYNYLPDGIFITHAHIGHYTGLVQLGREVFNTKKMPVYVLPKLKLFLETSGPWQQLTDLENIVLNTLKDDNGVDFPGGISVQAFIVPHRDEYSETAGFRISTKEKNYLFIPDINKWEIWTKNIVDEVSQVDIALLDATFYDTTELPGRRLSEVPHPFVTESVALFKNADNNTKSKIHFIHFNHTNPLLWNTKKQEEFLKTGFNLAQQGQRL